MQQWAPPAVKIVMMLTLQALRLRTTQAACNAAAALLGHCQTASTAAMASVCARDLAPQITAAYLQCLCATTAASQADKKMAEVSDSQPTNISPIGGSILCKGMNWSTAVTVVGLEDSESAVQTGSTVLTKGISYSSTASCSAHLAPTCTAGTTAMCMQCRPIMYNCPSASTT
jgi:hypothetical protein